MTIYSDLAKLLRDTLETRCQRNPKYSLRAFARDLGVPAPRLSRWMKGQDGLSRHSATQLAKRLGLSGAETELFILAMESKYARAKKVRESAEAKLFTISQQYAPLDTEAFRVIADWYNLAVLSLIETQGFRRDPSWIAQRLDISLYEAEGALNRLLELEMIEEAPNGILRPTGVFFANPTGIPSRSVRHFQAQILEKARVALEFQSVDERDFSTLVVAIPTSKLKEAKLYLKSMREEFESKFCSPGTEKDEVYALGIQMFRLSTTQTSPREKQK